MVEVYYKRGPNPLNCIEIMPEMSFSNLKTSIISGAKEIDATVQENAPLLFFFRAPLPDGSYNNILIEVIASSEEPRPEFRFITVKVASLIELRELYPLAGTEDCPLTVGNRVVPISIE